MKRLLTIILLTGLLGWVWQGIRAAEVRTRETMRLKLEYAQKVLEGIAIEDYGLIAAYADKLKELSQSADWQHRQTAEYQRHTGDFARHTDSLNRAAGKRNIDAAVVAYFQLTASCVGCHRHLRGNEQARLGFPGEPGAF